MAQVRVSIADLKSLATSVQKNNEDLRRLTNDLNSIATSTTWEGQAGNKFRDIWAQQKKNLTDLSAMLDDVKKEVDSRRERLEAFEA